jgi:hypothetical protein
MAAAAAPGYRQLAKNIRAAAALVAPRNGGRQRRRGIKSQKSAVK